MAKTEETIQSRVEKADNYLVQKRELWTENEKMLLGRLSDRLSAKTKSQVFDHKLSTLLYDRSARVMAQLPVGKIKPIDKYDIDAASFMNIALEKYVLPNATAQFDFLTKSRLMNLYSNVYGNMFAFIDQDIKKNGYTGPDMWLIPIRDVIPQVGAISLSDSDYFGMRTYYPLSWFEKLSKKDGYINIDKVIQILKNKPGDKQARTSDKRTEREESAYPQTEEPAKGSGFYEVISMFERDRWMIYVTAAKEIIKDSKNPHDDGELPIVNKYGIPLMDDFMGTSDTERGKSMQMASNSLWNLYLDGVKVSIFPPVLLNKNNIADTSSIKWTAAAKWLMKNNLADSAQTLNLTPQGASTFNNVYQTVTASMLNMFGTSDTAVTERVDPGFGKTPQALKMQQSRENARDNVDRFYQERFLEQTMKKFVNILSKKQNRPILLRMFPDEMEKLKRTMPKAEEYYDSEKGELKLDSKKFGSIKYDYQIVAGSTYALDQQEQQQNLIQLLELFKEGLTMGQNGLTSPMIEALRQEGKEVKIGELITRILANSGIQDWDSIVTTLSDEEQSQKVIGQMDEMVAQALQGGNMGVGQIPTADPSAMPMQDTALEGAPTL